MQDDLGRKVEFAAHVYDGESYVVEMTLVDN
jgi:hypothetical protein